MFDTHYCLEPEFDEAIAADEGAADFDIDCTWSEVTSFAAEWCLSL
jgi:hypothetical protein